MRGVSLIEVLVTTVVLALGLLGTSALQITGLKGSDSAHYRTQATFLANDLAERMRFNLGGVRDGQYQYDPATAMACHEFPDDYKNCSGSSCNSAELAAYDLRQINCGNVDNSDVNNPVASGGVVNALPQGSLSVNCGAVTCTERVDHTITLSWTSRADEGAGSEQLANESVVLSFVP